MTKHIRYVNIITEKAKQSFTISNICFKKGDFQMKDFEVHAFVSYVSGGTRYHDCYTEYVTAKNKAEAKKVCRERLKSEGIRLERAEILEAWKEDVKWHDKKNIPKRAHFIIIMQTHIAG